MDIKQKLRVRLGDFHATQQYVTNYCDKSVDEAYWLGIYNVLNLLKEECMFYSMSGIAKPALAIDDIESIERKIKS